MSEYCWNIVEKEQAIIVMLEITLPDAADIGA